MTQDFLEEFTSIELQTSTLAAIAKLSEERNLHHKSPLLMALILRMLPMRTIGIPTLDSQGFRENCCVLRDLQTILSHLVFLQFDDQAISQIAEKSSQEAFTLTAPINLDHISRFDSSLRHAHHLILGNQDVGGLSDFIQGLLATLKPELVRTEEEVIESFVSRADMWPLPSWAISENNRFLDLFGSAWRSDSHWSFWREWYQGFLDGKPLDWELQRRVALIPDADWALGPEHIARLIEEIRARFELEQRIGALEEELRAAAVSRHGIGGNFPPEPVDEPRVVQEIIWAPLEELKEEVASETPDKSRISAAISKLGAVLIAIGKWPLGKLDKAADEFAKTFGKLAATGAFAFVVSKIPTLIDAAQTWLSTLP